MEKVQNVGTKSAFTPNQKEKKIVGSGPLEKNSNR